MRDPAYYKNLWATAKVLPKWEATAERAANLIMLYRYTLYEGLGVPWELLGAVHCMECNCRPDRQVLNGQRWDQKTTLYPAGKGPWPSWKAAALEALERHSLQTLEDVECWNGMGYARRKVNSPYLCSGTDQYIKGKFKEVRQADGKFKSVFDPNLVSKQVGVIPILKALEDISDNILQLW